MPKELANFYENIGEACMRLENTVVLYDGEPYYILFVAEGYLDGIFRVHMCKVQEPSLMVLKDTVAELSPYDRKAYYENEAVKPLITRKHINSPLFKKFRPFSLGMVNFEENAYYFQRTPQRIKEQGLLPSMVLVSDCSKIVDTYTDNLRNYYKLSVTSQPFADMIAREYPSLQTCFEALSSGKYLNTSTAFHEDMAIARGPLGLLFLWYKTDIVGFFGKTPTSITIANEFRYLKEAIEETNVFQSIEVSENER